MEETGAGFSEVGALYRSFLRLTLNKSKIFGPIYKIIKPKIIEILPCCLGLLCKKRTIRKKKKNPKENRIENCRYKSSSHVSNVGHSLWHTTSFFFSKTLHSPAHGALSSFHIFFPVSVLLISLSFSYKPWYLKSLLFYPPDSVNIVFCWEVLCFFRYGV